MNGSTEPSRDIQTTTLALTLVSRRATKPLQLPSAKTATTDGTSTTPARRSAKKASSTPAHAPTTVSQLLTQPPSLKLSPQPPLPTSALLSRSSPPASATSTPNPTLSPSPRVTSSRRSAKAISRARRSFILSLTTMMSLSRRVDSVRMFGFRWMRVTCLFRESLRCSVLAEGLLGSRQRLQRNLICLEE